MTSCAYGENYSHELHMSRGYTERVDTEQWYTFAAAGVLTQSLFAGHNA